MEEQGKSRPWLYIMVIFILLRVSLILYDVEDILKEIREIKQQIEQTSETYQKENIEEYYGGES